MELIYRGHKSLGESVTVGHSFGKLATNKRAGADCPTCTAPAHFS
jgi:hypothetical protein